MKHDTGGQNAFKQERHAMQYHISIMMAAVDLRIQNPNKSGDIRMLEQLHNLDLPLNIVFVILRFDHRLLDHLNRILDPSSLRYPSLNALGCQA